MVVVKCRGSLRSGCTVRVAGHDSLDGTMGCVKLARVYLRAGESESEIRSVRECTHTGRPLGTEEFVKELEASTQRVLSPRKGGRPATIIADERQSEFSF